MTSIRKQEIQQAIRHENEKFEKLYLWMEAHLPESFFKEIDSETAILAVQAMMDFDVQEHFSHVHFKNRAMVFLLDVPDADLQILRRYRDRGIKSYRTFVSNAPPPFQVDLNLKIAMIHFTQINEEKEEHAFSDFKEVFEQLKLKKFHVTEAEFKTILGNMNVRFLRSLTPTRLFLVFEVLLRARHQDPCQVEVIRNENWAEKKETPSLQIVLAWRNVNKNDFLFRLVRIVHRQGLTLKRMAATYIDPYSCNNILVMSIGLHGANGKAAWEESCISDLLQEMVTVKYFPDQEIIETIFVDKKLVRGNLGNLIKTMVHFIHQVLVPIDPYLYSFSNIEEGFCRHPDLTVMLTKIFEKKFHPEEMNLDEYHKNKEKLIGLVDQIDTGQEINDIRRKNILKQAINFVEYTLKTNFYRHNKTAHSFRLNPQYLDAVPYDRAEKFPDLPFAIFFMKGLYFIGFHIRFRDLSRGGLRTIYPEKIEQLITDRNTLFLECYHLAYTQQKKNKDIPEGGAKGVILLEPYEKVLKEEEIYREELERIEISSDEIERKIKAFHQERTVEYLNQSQRSYIESFLTLINCESDGKLRAKHIVDYYKKAEYIYLGPDENLHNEMIIWISNYARYYHYKPGSTFISSKPGAGINHKEFGITSRGVNVYMEEVLKFIGIDPKKDPFTVKMTGGPDGDVAGNQMYNLYQFYPNTAKLLATIDVSGTIFDPCGLDLHLIAELFKAGKALRFYPAEKLSDEGFLLDVKTKREHNEYAHQTLLLRKRGGKVLEEWISGNEMNHLLKSHVHQVKADIFIPAGGRPNTLNEHNCHDFLDGTGKPSSKAIIEGGNLYLTSKARRFLEEAGVIIIKDSSANKGG